MQQLFQLFYQCSGVSSDTRKIQQDNLYIALKGDNFNGNKFAQQAIEKGAKYAIVDEQEYANNTTIFAVNDGLAFLQELANYHREKFTIPVLGITGSNGKTTTKELIAAVLNQKFDILYTEGNLNNHIGVPLTLLRLTNSHDIAIIEMGASKPNDIAELTAIANPTHGIITNIGNAHLEGFGGPEGVIKTKKELYDSIESVGGTLFMNCDDEVLSEIIPSDIELITYGESKDADIHGQLDEFIPEVVFSWRSKNGKGIEINTHIIGKYNFYNMLAAVAIGDYFEVSSEAINNAISNYIPKNNRSQIEKTARNTLILDAYNANPTSVRSSLESFNAMPYDDKFFVLGDMKELGIESINFHEEIIELTKKFNLQGVFIGEEYTKVGKKDTSIMTFISIDEARAFLQTAQPKENLILLKGSRSVGLERLKDIF
jgi:UDP-N-acetylmuramoyl-tripeptide--D-alanyl-D-alanine ligase